MDERAVLFVNFVGVIVAGLLSWLASSWRQWDEFKHHREMLEKRFSLLFHKRNATKTGDLVNKYVANSSSG